MDKKEIFYPVHLQGTICWLPPHRPDKKRFAPGINFRALAGFTGDYSGPYMTVLVNYSYAPIGNSLDCNKVRLHFGVLNGNNDEIKRLSKNCEVLILEAYKVIAVCRDIHAADSGNGTMEAEWLE